MMKSHHFTPQEREEIISQSNFDRARTRHGRVPTVDELIESFMIQRELNAQATKRALRELEVK